MWGAIEKYRELGKYKSILIRAPVWGAIICGYVATVMIFHFNPRTRVGCDLALFIHIASETTF